MKLLFILPLLFTCIASCEQTTQVKIGQRDTAVTKHIKVPKASRSVKAGKGVRLTITHFKVFEDVHPTYTEYYYTDSLTNSVQRQYIMFHSTEALNKYINSLPKTWRRIAGSDAWLINDRGQIFTAVLFKDVITFQTHETAGSSGDTTNQIRAGSYRRHQ